MILVFWMSSFKPAFSLSPFTVIKRLFSSSSLSAIKVVLFAYLRLLIFLLAILILACDSSSPAFWMMYTSHKLNKQGDNIQLWCTPFPILNQSVVPCPVLTVASWPAYRFCKRQERQLDIPISLRIFHSLLWSTAKGFSTIREAEVDVSGIPCFLYDPVNVGNLISGSSTFSKSSLYICKFLIHVLLQPSLIDFEHILASMWNECNCMVIWTFFGIAFLRDWNENWPFPALWPLLSFPHLLTYWVKHFHSLVIGWLYVEHSEELSKLSSWGAAPFHIPCNDYTRVPTSHPHQHLLPVFFITAILEGEKYFLISVLIYFSYS